MILNAKKRPLIAVALLLTSLGITTSCIDNSYDLNKDIDMTISAGGEHLAIPVGYTEKITLDKIIEIEEGDDLQLVDGEYHLLKGDDIEPSTTKVEDVTIDEIKSNIEKIDISKDSSTSSPQQRTSNENKYNTDFEKTGKIEVTAKRIDEAVKEIGELEAKDKVAFDIFINIEGEFSIVKVTNLQIELPDFLVFADTQDTEGIIIDKDNHKLSFNDFILKKNTTEEQGKFHLQLIAYYFAEKAGTGQGLVVTNKEINETYDVKVSGTAEVTLGTTTPTVSSNDKLYIIPQIMIAEMNVQNVTGVIQPKITPTNTIVKLENLPDFLSDNEVELDITNPTISFIANNPLETPIILNGEMLGKKADGSMIEGSTVKIGNGSKDGNKIQLNPGNNIIILSRTGKSNQENSSTVQNIQVSDINNLIKKIPDEVNVTLNPVVKNDDYYTVELKEDGYTMEGNYDIDIPLNFGSNLKIVYDETIDNFDLDLEDVDIKKAILSINAVNTIPLAMEIKNENVSALDANGNVIKDIDVTVEGTITESKDGKAEVSSTLNINLNETAEGAISKLDGLKLKVTAVPGQATDVQLLSTQWLQLTDMKLKIPNGIKVDLN
ncbi:hypothetical protein [Bacteroides clarus]|jgi:predicted transcriptional regulator|uniref:hypothetical protein n=1 Tax=Bacteroides clarus TaxID=626929 RepID=UPI001897B082|nr:hypothetical protein [Bacteroides clarus]MCQ1546441.1 hypothetical protein [Bacteroides clarus]